jgi:hypothetical protein
MANVAAVVKLKDYAAPAPGYVDLTSIPMPKQGGKIWLLEAKGMFLLERGPGTLRTICCTGAGSGTLIAVDGVPEDLSADAWVPIYKANPVVMGSWMLDGGFTRGLTLIHRGGPVPASASVVWVPFRGVG